MKYPIRRDMQKEWKEIRGYEGRYEISNFGDRIRKAVTEFYNATGVAPSSIVVSVEDQKRSSIFNVTVKVEYHHSGTWGLDDE